MTKLLQKALEAVRRLPPDSQDEIERVTLRRSLGVAPRRCSRGRPRLIVTRTARPCKGSEAIWRDYLQVSPISSAG